jgi:hypothetical protein
MPAARDSDRFILSPRAINVRKLWRNFRERNFATSLLEKIIGPGGRRNNVGPKSKCFFV